MKYLILSFVLLDFAVRAAEPIASGDWSEAVEGLRGRLHFAEDAPLNGTRVALIYLELENVSDVINPLLVDLPAPQLDLIDAAGKSVPQSPAAASLMMPPPYALVLPFDSKLRLRVSVSGYGISRSAGLAIQLSSGFWTIPSDNNAERYIRGTLSVPELDPLDIEGRRRDIKRGNRVWRGTLALPKLKIPLLK